MKEIIKSNILCTSILGKQKYDIGIKYRFFKYVLKYPCDNGVLLLNTLTLQMFYIENEVYQELFSLRFLNEFQILVNNYFLVPDEFDDSKIKNETLRLLNCFNTFPANEYTHFTIMPTMDCNARCFYCFEHGAKRNSMTEKTANDVADFICKKSNGKTVSIQWFGGEPLYNTQAIDIISKKLISKGISFKTRMISNGYLFSEDNIKKAKDYWNLKYVQITLDGTEEIYNRIKAYIYKTDESAFVRVLNNIELLLKNNIRVLIRLNMDKHNKDDLYNLIDALDVRFSRYKNNLSIYVWLLYNSRLNNSKKRSDEERSQLMETLFGIEEYIKDKDLHLKSTLKDEYKLYSCIADCDYAVTILPDGKIGKCDHYSSEKNIGDIYNDNIDNEMIDYWKTKCDPVSLCQDCPISPQCIKLKHCPDEEICDIWQQKYSINQYYNKMQNTYIKSLMQDKG